jgi:hypothetical protein
LDGDFQMRLFFQERCLMDEVNRRRAGRASTAGKASRSRERLDGVLMSRLWECW